MFRGRICYLEVWSGGFDEEDAAEERGARMASDGLDFGGVVVPVSSRVQRFCCAQSVNGPGLVVTA